MVGRRATARLRGSSHPAGGPASHLVEASPWRDRASRATQPMTRRRCHVPGAPSAAATSGSRSSRSGSRVSGCDGSPASSCEPSSAAPPTFAQVITDVATGNDREPPICTALGSRLSMTQPSRFGDLAPHGVSRAITKIAAAWPWACSHAASRAIVIRKLNPVPERNAAPRASQGQPSSRGKITAKGVRIPRGDFTSCWHPAFPGGRSAALLRPGRGLLPLGTCGNYPCPD